MKFSPGFLTLLAGDTYQPGKAQDSYDKQYVRDYLEEIRWEQTTARAGPSQDMLRTSEKYSGRIVSNGTRVGDLTRERVDR